MSQEGLNLGEVIIATGGTKWRPCPPWCDEHYTSADGTKNHSSKPRPLCAFDVYTGDPMPVTTWCEQRDTADEIRVVGVLATDGTNDAEMASYQLRELARHLVAVAEMVETTVASYRLALAAAVDRGADGRPELCDGQVALER